MAGYKVGDQSVISQSLWWLSQPSIAGSTNFGRLLPPAWSLDVEMQFYLVAPFVIALLAWPRPLISLTLVLLGVLWAGSRFWQGESIESPRLDLYLWIFLAGCLAERWQWRPDPKTVAISSVLFVSALVFALSFDRTRPIVWVVGGGTDKAGMLDVAVLNLILIVAGLPFAIRTTFQPSFLWDRWAGDLSYPLYLFHWIPRDWYYANVDWSLPVSRNGSLLFMNFAIAFLGALALLHGVDRPVQRLRTRWLSQRQSSGSRIPAAHTDG